VSVLADTPAADGASLRFVFDPADPTPTIGGRLLMGAAAGYPDDSALAECADVLTFTGPELDSALEVIGVPYVELAQTTDTPSADVAVRISDVDPDGRSRNVSDGCLRIGPKRSSPVRIDLDPIAHRFRPAHRIRLTGSGRPSQAVRSRGSHATSEPESRWCREPSSSAPRTYSTARDRGWCYRARDSSSQRRIFRRDSG
jgi:putative CocE/NonD family hydrolase